MIIDAGRLIEQDAIVRVAQGAERLGYTALWTCERLLYPLAEITYPDGTRAPLEM
jgi:hypothetical protein